MLEGILVLVLVLGAAVGLMRLYKRLSKPPQTYIGRDVRREIEDIRRKDSESDEGR